MTIFQIMWLAGGFIIGWIGIDMLAAFIAALAKRTFKVPVMYNLGSGFVGALIAYTLVR